MKMVAVLTLALVAIAVAAPPPVAEENTYPKIVRSEVVKDENGYKFAYETEDGISRDEQGEVKEILDEENEPHNVITIRGSYQYVNKEGDLETVEYYADETGFHAVGPSIPTAPPARR